MGATGSRRQTIVREAQSENLFYLVFGEPKIRYVPLRHSPFPSTASVAQRHGPLIFDVELPQSSSTGTVEQADSLLTSVAVSSQQTLTLIPSDESGTSGQRTQATALTGPISTAVAGALHSVIHTVMTPIHWVSSAVQRIWLGDPRTAAAGDAMAAGGPMSTETPTAMPPTDEVATVQPSCNAGNNNNSDTARDDGAKGTVAPPANPTFDTRFAVDIDLTRISGPVDVTVYVNVDLQMARPPHLPDEEDDVARSDYRSVANHRANAAWKGGKGNAIGAAKSPTVNPCDLPRPSIVPRDPHLRSARGHRHPPTGVVNEGAGAASSSHSTTGSSPAALRTGAIVHAVLQFGNHPERSGDDDVADRLTWNTVADSREGAAAPSPDSAATQRMPPIVRRDAAAGLSPSRVHIDASSDAVVTVDSGEGEVVGLPNGAPPLTLAAVIRHVDLVVKGIPVSLVADMQPLPSEPPVGDGGESSTTGAASAASIRGQRAAIAAGGGVGFAKAPRHSVRASFPIDCPFLVCVQYHERVDKVDAAPRGQTSRTAIDDISGDDGDGDARHSAACARGSRQQLVRNTIYSVWGPRDADTIKRSTEQGAARSAVTLRCRTQLWHTVVMHRPAWAVVPEDAVAVAVGAQRPALPTQQSPPQSWQEHGSGALYRIDDVFDAGANGGGASDAASSPAPSTNVRPTHHGGDEPTSLRGAESNGGVAGGQAATPNDEATGLSTASAQDTSHQITTDYLGNGAAGEKPLSSAAGSSAPPTSGLVDVSGPDCVICLNNPIDTIILPCRHLCLCSDCSLLLRQQDSNRCPVCRANIERLIRVK